LRLEIADAASVERKWGLQLNGMAVDLTLDRDTFELGEDLHLHIAGQNFSATEPVLGPSQLWDPCCMLARIRKRGFLITRRFADDLFAGSKSAAKRRGLWLPGIASIQMVVVGV